MSDQKRSRKRAVKLTPDALKLLNEALLNRWKDAESAAKLTRETRANLLGVSVATSERILGQKGVDRPTLTFVFKNLDLDWDDSLCESDVPEGGQVSEVSLPLYPAQNSISNRQFRFRTGMVVVGILAMLVIFAAGAQFLTSPRPSPNAWRNEFVLVLEEGTDSYHRGDFKNAEVKIGRAITLARANNAGRDLGFALRMAGDIASSQGSFREAMDCYKRALDLRSEFLDEFAEPAMLEALGDAETRIGDLKNAKKHLARSLELFRKYNDPVGMAMAYRNLGTVEFESGDMESATKLYESSLATVRGKGKQAIEMDVRGRQALILRETGRIEEARSQLSECLKYWKACAHPRWVATTQLQLGTVELRGGNIPLAMNYLVQSKQGFEAVGDRAGAADTAGWINKTRSPGRYHRGFNGT